MESNLRFFYDTGREWYMEFLKLLLLLLSLSGYYFLSAAWFYPRWHLRPSRSLGYIVVWLYLSLAVGQFKAGCYLAFVLGLALSLFGIIYCCRKHCIHKFWASPNYILYIVAFSLLWFRLRFNWFSHWDDFSHWGLAVKEYVHYNGPIPAYASLLGKHIPPGAPLFNGLGVHLLGFSEGNVIYTQNLLTLSPIWMLLPQARWRNVTTIISNISCSVSSLFPYHNPYPRQLAAKSIC